MFRRKPTLDFTPRRKFDAARFWDIFSMLLEIVIVIVIAYICVLYFGSRTGVIGQSMEPTLMADDQIMIDKLTYVFKDPQPGDIVIFQPNGNTKAHYYVRRVIAVPGDTVQIKNGIVYVNGAKFEEFTDVQEILDAGNADEEIELGEDEYFVLGDNRNNSEDSRYANIGNIHKEYIIGKAWFKFNSIHSFGRIR